MILKMSAKSEHKNLIAEYLNIKVISGYALLFTSLLINMYCMWFLPYKTVITVATSSYVFVVLLSLAFFGETLDLKKKLGSLLILFGMLVFNL